MAPSPAARWNKVKAPRIIVMGAEPSMLPSGTGEILMTARKVGEHVETSTDEARAGETGHHVRYILAAGVALVVIGFAAVAMGWFG